LKILALECSTRCGSVALLVGEELAREWPVPAGRAVRAELFRALQEGVGLVGSVERVVVGIGPGSYNGLRTAVSAAAGLAMSQAAELVPVASPLAVSDETEYWYVGDARSGMLHITHVCDGVAVAGPRLSTLAEAKTLIGQGRIPVFSAEPLPGLDTPFLPGVPQAARLARIGRRTKPETGVPEPLYLKPPHITTPGSRPRQ